MSEEVNLIVSDVLRVFLSLTILISAVVFLYKEPFI